MRLLLLGICIFILLFNIVVSFFRGTRKSLLRLATVVVAMVGAFFLARATSENFGVSLALKIEQALSAIPDLAPLFEGNAATDDVIAAFAEMLVTPVIFFVSFFTVKSFLLIPYRILVTLTGFIKESGLRAHLIGAAVGVLIGIVGILVLITPVFGYLEVASVLMAQVEGAELSANGTEESANTEESEKVPLLNRAAVDSLRETPMLGGLYNGIGSKIFDGLAVGKWGEQSVYLREELSTLADIVTNIKALGGKTPKEYGDAECAAIDAVAADVGSSTLLSTFFSGIVNSAADKWLAGEPFLGVAAPDVGANGNVLLQALLTVFSTSEPQNVGDDLDFFVDIFTLTVRYEILSKMENAEAEDFAVLITDSGFVDDVQALLATHPRMEPVGRALGDIGMRSVLKAMGFPEDLDVTHGALLEDVSSTLKNQQALPDGTIDKEALASDLKTVFAENEITVNDSSISLVVDGIAEMFTAEELQSLSLDSIREKLTERFEAVDTAAIEVPQA